MEAAIVYSICIVVTLIMFIRIIIVLKRNKKNKNLINCLNSFGEKESFFINCDYYINNVKDPEFIAKGNVIKLWGYVYYEMFDEIEPQLRKIELDDLIKEKKKKNNIALNEDSFFYLYIAIPNCLYGEKRMDMVELVKEKTDSISSYIENQMFYAISKENYKFYTAQEDWGETFFKNVTEGNYPDYSYSKQLIGLYKSIVTAMLVKVYVEKGKTEEIEEYRDDMVHWNKTNLGGRYLQELGLRDMFMVKEESVKELIEESHEKAEEEKK